MSTLRRRLMASMSLDVPIKFEDAEVKRICVENFGGLNGITKRIYGKVGVKGIEGEITYRQALAVKTMFEVFKLNKDIVSFNEFKLFKNIDSLQYKTSFYGCTSLQRIELPATISYVPTLSLSAIKEITLPNRITQIGSGTFHQCKKLTTVNGLDHIEKIEDAAFYTCSSLRDVVIPDSVVSIGQSAFQNCMLGSITLGKGITKLGLMVFGYSKITSDVVIPDNITFLNDSLFQGNAIKHIRINGEPKYIGHHSLSNNAINTLVYILLPNCTTPPTLCTDSFDSNRPKIYVIDSSVEVYKISENWSALADYILPISQFKTDFPNEPDYMTEGL